MDKGRAVYWTSTVVLIGAAILVGQIAAVAVAATAALTVVVSDVTRAAERA